MFRSVWWYWGLNLNLCSDQYYMFYWMYTIIQFKCAIFHFVVSSQTPWPRNPQNSGLSRRYPLNLEPLLVYDILFILSKHLQASAVKNKKPNSRRSNVLFANLSHLLYLLEKICTTNAQHFWQYPLKAELTILLHSWKNKTLQLCGKTSLWSGRFVGKIQQKKKRAAEQPKENKHHCIYTESPPQQCCSLSKWSSFLQGCCIGCLQPYIILPNYFVQLNLQVATNECKVTDITIAENSS